MALTKVSRGLLTTSIVDNGNATAITIAASGATTLSSTLAVTGEITANGGIALGDSDKATFGASDNLQIYHDGSNSYIDDAATGHLFIRSNGDGIYLRSNTNEEIAHFNVNGSVKAYYDNSLKLATTSTGIDVTGTATMDGLTAVGADTALAASIGSAGQRVYITPNGTEIIYNASGNSAGQHVWQTGNAERMRIDASGNLQLGTGTPAYLVGSGDIAQLSVNRVGTSGAITNTSRSAAFINVNGASGGSSIEFSTASANNTQPTERMRIAADGQVGVSSRKGFRFGNNQLQGNAGSSGGGYPVIGYNLAFTSTGGNYGTLVGDTAWRIDIGDNARLQIHSRSSANPVSSGAAFTAGPYVALNGTTWTGGSDERLKENISVITGADAIARVKAMRPVNYSWIHDSESANQLGFIAQEMLSAVPEVVDVPETETDPITQQTLMWGITYDRLIPVLTAALQEALTKIETLEAKVQTLENN